MDCSYSVLNAIKDEVKNRRVRLVERVAEQVSDGVPKLIGGGAKQMPPEIGHLISAK